MLMISALNRNVELSSSAMGKVAGGFISEIIQGALQQSSGSGSGSGGGVPENFSLSYESIAWSYTR
jgi:hypothetical protein